ncbi:unnamed protein product [Pedinophyceae sp. YPF-701]|nr:unnamed protein product [Pedinophyceae sp. YPF-701]
MLNVSGRIVRCPSAVRTAALRTFTRPCAASQFRAAFSTMGGSSSRPRSAAVRAESEDEKSRPSGHQVGSGSVISEENIDPEILAFRESQKDVARISLACEARTLIQAGKNGVLSTIDSSAAAKGFPAGSVAAYAVAPDGQPFFVVSRLATHQHDIAADPRVSLTVTADGFQGLQDGRATLIGSLTPVPDADKPELRELFLERHPNAFWVDFGDFLWYRMTDIKVVRFIGGFGRIGQKISPEEYLSEQPDPITQFAGPVCGHMNDDHMDANIAIVKSSCGISVDKASMVGIDKLGMTFACEREGQTFKARVAFKAPAESRADVKTRIVELTQAAKSEA